MLKQGYPRLPTELYKFYRKTDEDILREFEIENMNMNSNLVEDENETENINQSIGTKMVVDHYVRWLNEESSSKDDSQSKMIKTLYGGLKKISKEVNIFWQLSHVTFCLIYARRPSWT